MSDSMRAILMAAGATTAMTMATAAVQTAGAAERGLDRVIACADEADNARRLACYDREIASVRPKPAKAPSAAAAAVVAPPAAAAKPAAAAPAVAPATDFGIQGSEVARQRKLEQDQEQGQQVKAEADSISAKVTEVSTRPRGELVVTLDNGQAWVQKKVEPYFPVKAGDQVTINSGMLGSFRLVNGKRSTQVTRVK